MLYSVQREDRSTCAPAMVAAALWHGSAKPHLTVIVTIRGSSRKPPPFPSPPRRAERGRAQEVHSLPQPTWRVSAVLPTVDMASPGQARQAFVAADAITGQARSGRAPRSRPLSPPSATGSARLNCRPHGPSARTRRGAEAALRGGLAPCFLKAACTASVIPSQIGRPTASAPQLASFVFRFLVFDVIIESITHAAELVSLRQMVATLVGLKVPGLAFLLYL